MGRNRFVQAVGLLAIGFIIFVSSAWLLNSVTYIARDFLSWVQWTLLPFSFKAAVAAGVIYLIVAAVKNSR